MSMYTFLFSHKNTICIRQAQGNTLEEAVNEWLPMLGDVQFGKDEEKSTLDLPTVRQELKEARLVPLRKLTNVWCTFLRFNGTNAIINVVLTQGESDDAYVLDDETALV
jgi:hypothetical protein